MKPIKKERTAEILHKLAADFVLRESTPSSLITITRIELNESGKSANFFFTTIPENQEDTVLKFLVRKGGELNEYIRNKSKIGIVPHFTWRIDYGERNRQRLDEITNEAN